MLFYAIINIACCAPNAVLMAFDKKRFLVCDRTVISNAGAFRGVVKGEGRLRVFDRCLMHTGIPSFLKMSANY